jgi:aerobic carbon-monoxide dehydrogenase large subunit
VTPLTGQAIHRIEDERLVTGRARWTGNVAEPGMLHLGILRSPAAHGRLRRVDVGKARQHPGVVAAFTGADLAADWKATLPIIAPPGSHKPAQLPVAIDKVRFVGEPIAAVIATSAAAAADAVEMIETDLEVLPPVTMTDAASPDAVLVHEDVGTNVAFEYQGNRVGDLDAAFAGADVVVERRFEQPRVMGVALEPRAVVVAPQPDGSLLVHTSTQAPHRIRDHIAKILGLDAATVRLIAKDVGGGFGPKLDCYPEDLICATVAHRLGQPVRFVATRSEDLQATHHGRGQIQEIRVSARADGTLLGLQVRVIADCGAYLSRVGGKVPTNGDEIFPGCYRWQAYSFEATGHFTTSVPTAAYRGAGRPEATYGVERAIDELAAALGMDPSELRRRNFPAADEFPFPSIGGLTYDSGDYARAMDLALEAVDYEAVRAEQRSRLVDGHETLVGIGLSSYVDRCGTGPGLPEFGAVRVDPGGSVEVATGLGPTGQGTLTSLGQIVADELGVDLPTLRFLYGDTGEVPTGHGTFGSRSMAVGGVAVHTAARSVAEEARRRTALLLEASPGDIVLSAGRCHVRGSPEAAVSLFELAGEEPLAAEELFDPPGMGFPYGAHVAVVEVDTMTGLVRLRRFVAVDDCGVIINPALLGGQLHGGIVQGIAQALYEEVVQDEEGNLVTGTLMDYHVPAASDVPGLELQQTVTPGGNPLGVKGGGESGTIGAPAAVMNAILDALRPRGVAELQMPATPEQVWRALQQASATAEQGA